MWLNTGESNSQVKLPSLCLAVQALSGQVAELKDQGNKLFGGKEYIKAFELYDKAIRLLPAKHAESVLLHSNKAACSMMLKKCAKHPFEMSYDNTSEVSM